MNLQVIASPRGGILRVSGRCLARCMTEGRVDLGRPGQTGDRRPDRPAH